MTNTTRHHHTAAIERGPYGYTGAVAVHPYTEENRAAHGGVEYVECCACGYERRRLANGRHEEVGVWQKGAALRRREAEERRAAREIADALDRARRLMRGVELLGGRVRLIADVGVTADDLLRDDACVVVWIDGRTSTPTIGDLRQAGREWSDGPADDPRTTLYPAIAVALP